MKPAKVVLKWLQSYKLATVKRSDIWRGVRKNSVFNKEEDLSPAMKLLCIHGYLRWAGNTNAGNPQIRNSSIYELNPCLLG